MTDILAKIAAYKRKDVAARKAREPNIGFHAARAGSTRGFKAALERAHAPGRLALIAEIKKASPSKGIIREDFDPSALAQAYERGGAACLSILTDEPSFMGADRYLAAARDAAALPCIRKDFLVDPWQVAESRALGADAILVILAMIDDALAADLMAEAARLGMDALVEVNNRDLKTFTVDLAITERLAARAPAGALLVTESGLFTAADAARLEGSGAKAMLVGESLMRQADVEAATRALLG
jgi:indole-3-glycerol phosphate synthase